MTIDLSQLANSVITAPTLEEKKSAMIAMIENSHAKKTTKTLFMNKVKFTGLSSRQVDKLAYDYMMSGEGMKVR